jgi:copper(I)-binding protein
MFQAGVATAADVQVGSLVIEAPWSRATPGGAKVGAGYLAVVNTGDNADRLVSASSDIAERVEIHTMTMENGVMRMRRLKDGLVLHPQEVTELKPGGHHIMFIGLKRPIKKDDELAVELVFEKAGKVQLKFVAAGIGATQAPGAGDIGPAGGSHSGVGGSHDGRAKGSHTGTGQNKGSH